jgi:hypothetical protein
MTNLEIITAARKMGYTPILKTLNDDVNAVLLHEIEDNEDDWARLIVRLDNGKVANWNNKNDDGLVIVGWLFVGHLFGEPEIPQKQKFRVKRTGEGIIYWSGYFISEAKWNPEEDGFFSKPWEKEWCGEPEKRMNEIEPVFD